MVFLKYSIYPCPEARLSFFHVYFPTTSEELYKATTVMTIIL